MNELASALTGLEGERIALRDVAVSAVLQDLLAEVTVSQTYRNAEHANIEAVYTFPLPLDAVLLELEVEIGERVLKGVVVEKRAAEEQYEDAVEAGDAAVMLEAIEPGLYTMNVGNLLPQETAKITFRYAMLYRWTGDSLRFFLPTTIAPRYGDSPHQPHQVPEASLKVENQFSLRVEVRGALRDAQFVCPSHAVELVKSPEAAVLSLCQPKAVMDRDFVLNLKASQATRSFLLCGQDGDGVSAIASFQPFFPGLQQPRALNLVIVVDCSGSMHGDSMQQAKQALDGILDGLQPADRIALVAFGTTINALTDRPLPCNKTNVAKAKDFAKALEANLGGTEIGNALRESYRVAGRSESADIFLLTDGEVSDWQTVVDEAKKSGHRIFTVGVGSAVSEAFVRELAAGTGGACELVSPREGMADRVMRHFERMRAPRAKRVAVRWPEGAANITPAGLGAVFEGDTVVTCAQFDRAPAQGATILEVETDEGETVRQELVFPATPTPSSDGVSTVARVAAANRLNELDAVAGLETALRYRLVSPWTNWLVVARRADEERTQDLPALRKVPQTLAAGWGGTGSATSYAASMPPSADAHVVHSKRLDLADLLDIPMFLRGGAAAMEAAPEPPQSALPVDLPEHYRRLLELINENASRLDVAGALGLLMESGLDAEFRDLFRHAADLDLSVEGIAAIVLARVLDDELGEFLSSGDAQVALWTLREHVRETTDALQEMGLHGMALARLTQEPVAREVLRPRSNGKDLERFAQIRGLLEYLDDAVSRSRNRLQRDRAEYALRERSQPQRVGVKSLDV